MSNNQPIKTPYEALKDLKQFILYLENTNDEEWQVDTVRNEGNTKNCCMGHLVNWYYGEDYEGSVSDVWDWFEEYWATTYMIYPVNDGQDPLYQQSTPRKRIIAYLKDLNSGKAKNTRVLWEEAKQRI